MNKLLVPSSALLWGLQLAFLSPALALILDNLYGATTAEVGWVLSIYNASGFVASLLLPSRSARDQLLGRNRILPRHHVRHRAHPADHAAATERLVLRRHRRRRTTAVPADDPRPGLSTGLYTNTRRLGSIVSGPIIAIGSLTALGLRGIFLICAVITLIGLAIITIASRTTRHPKRPATLYPAEPGHADLLRERIDERVDQ